MALDDAGLLGHADLTQQGRADGRMMTVDVERVDLVGRMHRVEERQCLRWQVRAHKGVVSLPHMLRDSAHELAHAPVHLLQHGQAR